MKLFPSDGFKLKTYLLISGTVILLYFQAVSFDFTYDDFWQIHRNALITAAGHSLGSFLALFTTPTLPGDLFRPVPLLTYRATYLLCGLNPIAFHAFNVLLFALVCCVVFRLFLALVPSRGAPLAAALLFAVHPVNVESVASVVGRAEMLAALFGLLASTQLVKLLRADRRISRYRRMLTVFVLFFAAFLSKESALVFVALAPIYAFLATKGLRGSKETRAQLLTVAVPVLLALAGYFILRHNALGGVFVKAPYDRIIAENPLFHFSFADRLIPALKILGDYVLLLLFPVNLRADYSIMPDDLLMKVYSFDGLAVVTALFAFCAILWSQRHKVWGFWGLWFLLAFALSCNILFPSGTLMAERLAFLPAIGFLAVFVYGMSEYCDSIKVSAGLRTFLVCGLIGALFARSLGRIPVWRNNVELFAQTALDSTLSPKAAFNYGVELARAKKNSEAEEYFRRALELNPEHLPSAKALADILLERGALARVEYWYRFILKRDPRDKVVGEALEKLLKLKITPESPTIAGKGAVP